MVQALLINWTVVISRYDGIKGGYPSVHGLSGEPGAGNYFSV